MRDTNGYLVTLRYLLTNENAFYFLLTTPHLSNSNTAQLGLNKIARYHQSLCQLSSKSFHFVSCKNVLQQCCRA